MKPSTNQNDNQPTSSIDADNGVNLGEIMVGMPSDEVNNPNQPETNTPKGNVVLDINLNTMNVPLVNNTVIEESKEDAPVVEKPDDDKTKDDETQKKATLLLDATIEGKDVAESQALGTVVLNATVVGKLDNDKTKADEGQQKATLLLDATTEGKDVAESQALGTVVLNATVVGKPDDDKTNDDEGQQKATLLLEGTEVEVLNKNNDNDAEGKEAEKTQELGSVVLNANVVGKPDAGDDKSKGVAEQQTPLVLPTVTKNEAPAVELKTVIVGTNDGNAGVKSKEDPHEIIKGDQHEIIEGESQKPVVEELRKEYESDEEGAGKNATPLVVAPIGKEISVEPKPVEASKATTSVQGIGLQGTVYFYVNQDANPLLMSGDINHNFDITDTKNNTNCVANLPIQIEHNIDKPLILSNAPFEAKVSINGKLCIGGNVYNIKSGHDIDVKNIVHIPPLPDATFPIGNPGNAFFNKYFEYSGKIYMDDWSSKIHWYTFYNPDNYKVSRELPTKNDTNGVFGNSNWALYQRKINMDIGKITVTNGADSVNISPPSFSIDMQKTSYNGGTGGVIDTQPKKDKDTTPGKQSKPNHQTSSKKKQDSTIFEPKSSSNSSTLRTPSKKSSNQKDAKPTKVEFAPKDTNATRSTDLLEAKEGLTLLTELLNNVDDKVKTQVLNNISDILKPGQKLTENNEILNLITDKIINPLVSGASNKDPEITKKKPPEKLQEVVKKLLELPTTDLNNIVTELRNPTDNIQKSQKGDKEKVVVDTVIEVADSLIKPRTRIQAQISGTLTTSSGDKYKINHIIWLLLSVSNDSKKTYTVSRIYKADTNVSSSSTKTETKTFYVNGNFGAPVEKEEESPQNSEEKESPQKSAEDSSSKESPFVVLCENEQQIELDLISKASSNQSIQKPYLEISHFHIYIGEKTIKYRMRKDPSFVIQLNSFTLHNNLDKPDENVLCDFHSNITVKPKSQTNEHISQTHTTFEYDVTVVDESNVSKTAQTVVGNPSSGVPERPIKKKLKPGKQLVGKAHTEKKGIKVGGRRTRRFR